MKIAARDSSRFRGRAGVVVLAAMVSFGAAACSSATPDASSTAASTADAQAAMTAVDAGLKAHAAGDLAAASAQYNKALSLDKTNKYALYNLALIDAANGNYGLAEAKYRSALDTDPKYEPALFNLAILRTSADPKEAIALYQRAVAADSKDAAALFNLGLLLRTNGDKETGDKDILTAIAMNPSLKDPAAPAKQDPPQAPAPTTSSTTTKKP
jgi:tetratricopeptide (TPR) repeat protein